MAQYFLVSNQADEQAALNAGIPASQIRYVGETSGNSSMGNGYQAPTDLQTLPAGATGVYIGQAARYAPVGAQTVVGATRTQTQAALQQYAPSAATTQGTMANMSATGYMSGMLGQLGLSSLSQWALNLYAQSGSWDYVQSQLPTTPQFQARFPAWQTWVAEGGTAADYVKYENTLYQAAHAAGFPAGSVNQNTITNWINNGVSAAEGQQRIQDAVITTSQLPAEDVDYMERELGISKGDLAAYWLDPKHTLPLLQAKLATAQIGGAATDAGISLDTDLAAQLAKQGITQDQARQGFDQLANDRQLFQPLPGQQGNTLTQAQQVGGEFGTDAAAQQALAKARAGRIAPFKAGGGFASDSTGFVGAGDAKGA